MLRIRGMNMNREVYLFFAFIILLGFANVLSVVLWVNPHETFATSRLFSDSSEVFFGNYRPTAPFIRTKEQMVAYAEGVRFYLHENLHRNVSVTYDYQEYATTKEYGEPKITLVYWRFQIDETFLTWNLDGFAVFVTILFDAGMFALLAFYAKDILRRSGI